MIKASIRREAAIRPSVRGAVLVALTVSSLFPGDLQAQDRTPVTPEALAAAALERTAHRVTYDGSYRSIAYPWGDVPDSLGVCTDVVIRSYRALGIDLQRLVHEDMVRHFDAYPDIWGATRPDRNIDHRRVPNLQVFFTRHGKRFPVTDQAGDYRAGDLVTWMLPGNLPHIGIVAGGRSIDGARNLIIHNVGAGPRVEDVLFAYPVTGHYRFLPDSTQGDPQ